MPRTRAKISPDADRKLKQVKSVVAEYRRQVDALQSSKHHACCTCVKLADDTIESIQWLVNELIGED